jgi:hypothetical protein
MQNTKELFKSIDEASDKAIREKYAKENKEFARRKAIGEKISKCGFHKYVRGMYAAQGCTNPDRTTIKLKDGFRYRDCLNEDCPLIK